MIGLEGCGCRVAAPVEDAAPVSWWRAPVRVAGVVRPRLFWIVAGTAALLVLLQVGRR